MSIDISEVLKTLGGQIADKTIENVKAAAEQLTDRDKEIVERASQRKAELLIAKLLGQDTTADEVQIDETLALIAGKAGRIASATIKRTALEVIKTVAGVALKLVIGVVLPI